MRRYASRVSMAVLLVLAAPFVLAWPAFAGSLGGPMELADEGSFFVGGQVVRAQYPALPATELNGPGQITINQMYVHYRIPVRSNGTPVIMVHGSNHTGMTYETTPDGREGWATYFVRKGFPVYVVDHAGRGRSGFDGAVINRAKAEKNADALPSIQNATRERGWVNFLFGPAPGQAWPDLQFPLDALDQYTAQLVPNSEATLADAGANTINALALLLDKVGPAIVMVHSQSGAYGVELVRRRANLVKAFIDVEGDCGPLSQQDVANAFIKVPYLAFWGDHSEGAAGFNGDVRRNGCVTAINTVNAAGGSARFLLLPEMGIRGNSHMLMMDKNNLQLADIMIDWVGKVALK
jgi:pimeloyl-ACP methyl ester carboxylesterase